MLIIRPNITPHQNCVCLSNPNHVDANVKKHDLIEHCLEYNSVVIDNRGSQNLKYDIAPPLSEKWAVPPLSDLVDKILEQTHEGTVY